jgi:hypothetical protein
MVRSLAAPEERAPRGACPSPALMLLYNNVAELRQIVGAIVSSTVSKGSVLQAHPEFA